MSAAEVARGKRLIGLRLGGAVTRSAPWRIADRAPELGWLTGSRRLAAGQPVPEQLTSPQAVPHLAFVLGGPLTGSGVSPAGALAAVASVHAAVELAAGDSGPDMLADGAAAGDSGPDVIADGAAAGWFLVSPAGLRPGWTWPWRRAWSRWTAKWSTPAPGRPPPGIRPRRWPGRPARWTARAWRWNPAGWCSPVR